MAIIKRENKMEQKSGSDSQNIQVGGNLIVGISATEARQIALDIFKANFYELSENALKTANERAVEITNKFVEKFYAELPHLKAKLEEPAVQSSVFQVQKEYAKNGNEELEDRLLIILLERINSEERSLKQIVLDEALSVLPKLTNEHVDILTLIYCAVYLNHNDINNIQTLIDFIDSKLLKFYPENFDSYSFFTHFQFTGCCTLLTEGSKYKPLEQIILKRYKGLFNKGFTNEKFLEVVEEDSQSFINIVTKCLQEPSLLQLNALTDEVLDYEIKKYNYQEKEQKLKLLFNQTTMPENDVVDYLNSINPRIKDLFTIWKKTDIKSLRPTSVGLVIAIINYNNKTGSNIKIEGFI